MKSINIGNKTLVSDFRLPGNKEIIFLSLGKIFSIKVYYFDYFQLMDDQQKYS